MISSTIFSASSLPYRYHLLLLLLIWILFKIKRSIYYSMEEEVWRDISLSSLHLPSNSSTAASVSLALDQDFSVQDFLSCPPPPNGKQIRVTTGQGGWPHSRVAPVLNLLDTTKTRTRPEVHCSTERSHHHDPSSTIVEPQEDQLHESQDAFGGKAAAASFTTSCLDPLLINYSSPLEFPILCKKRNPESDDSTSDHRKKRQMKNRESAARSRARKQAYTTGLEVKVSRLAEENGRLRRQLEKLCTAAASVQCPKKHTLQRTLTAPF